MPNTQYQDLLEEIARLQRTIELPPPETHPFVVCIGNKGFFNLK